MKTEAFAIVQIEAMSLGKPVVATRIPQSGVPWVNAHGQSGLNAEPCNAEDLVRCIKAVLEDKDAYNRFSEGALERYHTMFTQEQMINNCLEIYSKLWS
jgi:rhamnosyl/mannosyltransferase